MYAKEQTYFAQMYNYFGYSIGGSYEDGVETISLSKVKPEDHEKLKEFIKRTDLIGGIKEFRIVD